MPPVHRASMACSSRSASSDPGSSSGGRTVERSAAIIRTGVAASLAPTGGGDSAGKTSSVSDARLGMRLGMKHRFLFRTVVLSKQSWIRWKRRRRDGGSGVELAGEQFRGRFDRSLAMAEQPLAVTPDEVE